MAEWPASVASSSRRSALHSQTLAGVLVLAAAAILVLAGSRQAPEFGIYAVLGLGFGVALQRSRFCFNAAFRDLFQFRSGRTMKCVIIGMAVATAGFGLHMYNLLPNPGAGARLRPRPTRHRSA